jgi:tRNA threonylcarbamoyladenosine modification (KEOPS) complex  Pcc1 subunit
MKAKATIRIKVSSIAHLTSLLEAVKPETKRLGNRSKVEIYRDGFFVILNVEAKDTIALRATLNTYLRWIGSTLDTLKVLSSI